MLGDPTTALLSDASRESCRKIGGDFYLGCISRHHQGSTCQRVEAGTRGAVHEVPGNGVSLCRIEYVIDPVTVMLSESAAIHR